MKFFILAISLALFSMILKAQPLRINEVMSSNGGLITDSDGDPSDWIELYNPGTTSVNLYGYGLSDNKGEPFKWVFPSFNVGPGKYLLVYASGKDRRETPAYWNTIIAQGDDWKYLVPTAEPATNWRVSTFDDSSWNTGKSGFGMGDNDDATVLTVTTSVFLRKKFTIDNIAQVKDLAFFMDYDDGFVAYLNGVEIARAQMDGQGSLPRFDVLASGNHEAVMYNNMAPPLFQINTPAPLLKNGENILAIQVHNQTTTSSDVSAIPFLAVSTFDKPDSVRTLPVLKLNNAEFHTNFKLDADGESLYLTNPAGALVDSVRISPLMLNYSFGRSSKDFSKWMVFIKPSPAKENSGEEVIAQKPARPVFNMPGGVYAAAIKLSVTSPDRSDTIYYTLDGTIPTTASLKISGEMNISSTKVIKARILKKGMLPGDVVTNSYIIYNNHQLPVVSLSMNPTDLWDYNTGIYVDGPGWDAPNPHFGANYWKDWERACHFELMETTGEKVTEVDAGISIFGNWSRANAQKSLALYCRKDYGYSEINYKIFNERPYKKYKNIVLRNSGNDWNNSMFRDGLVHSLTYGLNLDQMAYRPSIIFLNGEYWGIQNIREKINEHMIAQHHNVDPDSITILENHATIIRGDEKDYWTMFNFVEANHLTTQANYNKMLTFIDVNSFIDYWSTQIYINNKDWPGNNIRYWKTNDVNGRWRWILYDTDFGMGVWNTSATENTLSFALEPNGPGWPNPPWSTLIFRRLVENPAFVSQFVNRFCDLLNTNFKSETVNKAIDSKSAAIAQEIGNHMIRWSGSRDYWLENVKNMKTFASIRPTYLRSHIRQQFNYQLPQLITANVDSTQGTIQLNTLLLRNYPWKGYYFPDVPITMTAIPKVGFRFVKWTGITTGSTSATVKVTPQAFLTVTALFEPDGNHYDDVVINEISCNNNAPANPGDWIELYNKGSFDIDISGWKVTDSDANHQYIFAANTVLKANEYLVLSDDPGLLNNTFSVQKNLYGPFNFGLSTTSDAVKLFSREGQLIDEVNYGNTLPWPSAGLDVLWSLELKNPWQNNNNGANWVISVNTGTPGMINSGYVTGTAPVLAAHGVTNELLQNYPNPFKEGTYMEFKLDNPGKYTLSVMDLNGRVLRILKGDDVSSSVHTLYWDGKDESGKAVPAGIYFYRLETDTYSDMKRMVKVM
ncbi:MAG: CotH kinase family protein [Candidatus Saccharibacteria bacterium]